MGLLSFLGRSKSKRKLSVEEQLSAKPIQLVESEMLPTDDGAGKLKVKLKPGKWNAWFFKMPEGASKTFEFDPIGRLVWDSCDGKTSVQQIIRKLSKRYNLSGREAQVSTMMFLNTLTKKGLIAMAMKDRDARASGGDKS